MASNYDKSETGPVLDHPTPTVTEDEEYEFGMDHLTNVPNNFYRDGEIRYADAQNATHTTVVPANFSEIENALDDNQ